MSLPMPTHTTSSFMGALRVGCWLPLLLLRKGPRFSSLSLGNTSEEWSPVGYPEPTWNGKRI